MQKQQQIEDDRVRQNVLQSYIRDMTELLLDRRLAAPVPISTATPDPNSTTTPVPKSPVRQIARASTLSALRQLDGERKGLLVRFLYESNLIGAPPDIAPIIDLSGADLSDANLEDVRLIDADLRGANLSRANLHGAILHLAALRNANLNDADLTGADPEGAILRGINLGDADWDSNLEGANLSNADLTDADLSNAIGWTNEQLAQAESLVGATMPDGTVMTEKGWEDFKELHR
jgi:hypothetical protein